MPIDCTTFVTDRFFRAWPANERPRTGSTKKASPALTHCTANISLSVVSLSRLSWSFKIPDSTQKIEEKIKLENAVDEDSVCPEVLTERSTSPYFVWMCHNILIHPELDVFRDVPHLHVDRFWLPLFREKKRCTLSSAAWIRGGILPLTPRRHRFPIFVDRQIIQCEWNEILTKIDCDELLKSRHRCTPMHLLHD